MIRHSQDRNNGTVCESAEYGQRTEGELLTAVFDTVDALVLVLDRSGRIVRFNRACEEASGYGRDEVQGRYVWDLLLAQEEIGQVRQFFGNLQAGLFPNKFTSHLIAKDGRKKLISWSNTALTNSAGLVEYIIPTGIEIARDIAERTRAEERLKLYSAAMDEAMDGVQIVDLDGRIVYSNKAIEEIYGYLPEELAGKHVNELNTDPDFAREAILPVLRQKGRWSGELPVRHKSGAERMVWLSASTVRNEKGEPSAVVAVIRDMTRRNRVEEDIRRNSDIQFVINGLLQASIGELSLEEILRYALEQILVLPWLAVEAKGGIFLSGDAGNTLALKAWKGLDERLMQSCGTLTYGQCLCGRAAMTQEVQFADCVDGRHEIAYEGMTPHGHYCVPILFAGKTLGVITLYLKAGHQRDDKEVRFLRAIANALAGVIQRKRMEGERERLIAELQGLIAKVTHSKQLWQETFDSITDLIYITDLEYGILKANRAFSDYYGLRPRDVLGQKCYALVYGKAAPEPDCPHTMALRQGKQAGMEMTSPDGAKTFLISVFPYYDPDGNPQGSISIMRDVTERKEQEQRLAMSERLAALGRMASGIAHEINNPLAAINGCAEGLLARIDRDRYSPDFFKNYLSIIQEEIFRCKSITTGMLSFVKKEIYETRSVDLHALIEKSIEVIGYQGRLRNVRVVRRLHPEMPLIRGSEGELRQVLLALITNALDAIKDHGELTIATDVEIDYVSLAISDCGPGIPEANQSKIFDPFFTTKSDSGGTGLGLAIANKIITNHNGTIRVSSEVGKGARFTIGLPYDRDAGPGDGERVNEP